MPHPQDADSAAAASPDELRKIIKECKEREHVVRVQLQNTKADLNSARKDLAELQHVELSLRTQLTQSGGTPAAESRLHSEGVTVVPEADEAKPSTEVARSLDTALSTDEKTTVVSDLQKLIEDFRTMVKEHNSNLTSRIETLERAQSTPGPNAAIADFDVPGVGEYTSSALEETSAGIAEVPETVPVGESVTADVTEPQLTVEEMTADAEPAAADAVVPAVDADHLPETGSRGLPAIADSGAVIGAEETAETVSKPIEDVAEKSTEPKEDSSTAAKVGAAAVGATAVAGAAATTAAVTKKSSKKPTAAAPPPPTRKPSLLQRLSGGFTPNPAPGATSPTAKSKSTSEVSPAKKVTAAAETAPQAAATKVAAGGAATATAVKKNSTKAKEKTAGLVDEKAVTDKAKRASTKTKAVAGATAGAVATGAKKSASKAKEVTSDTAEKALPTLKSKEKSEAKPQSQENLKADAKGVVSAPAATLKRSASKAKGAVSDASKTATESTKKVASKAADTTDAVKKSATTKKPGEPVKSKSTPTTKTSASTSTKKVAAGTAAATGTSVAVGASQSTEGKSKLYRTFRKLFAGPEEYYRIEAEEKAAKAAKEAAGAVPAAKTAAPVAKPATAKPKSKTSKPKPKEEVPKEADPAASGAAPIVFTDNADGPEIEALPSAEENPVEKVSEDIGKTETADEAKVEIGDTHDVITTPTAPLKETLTTEQLGEAIPESDVTEPVEATQSAPLE